MEDLTAAPETAAQWTARLSPTLRPIARRARAAIRAAFPEAKEYVHFGVLRYGVSSAPRDWLLYLSSHRDHLNLGFMRGVGAAVADPSGIIEGSGRMMRHTTLRTVADADRPALAAVLRGVAKLAREGAPARRRPAVPARRR